MNPQPPAGQPVVEYRVSICGRGGGESERYITVAFHGFDARHDGQGSEEQTVLEAVEYMLPAAHRVGRMSRSTRREILK